MQANTDLTPFLNPSTTVDSDHEAIRAFAETSVGRASGTAEKATRLFYAVRDGIRYDPYAIDLTVEGLRATATLEKGRGWCVPKAVLLAAGCRAAGIPARLGFADVRNHLSTARMREQMQTDIFFWHGYTSIFIDGAWRKATPAFNIELCDKFRLKPLEFDGASDAIYHPFDREGNRHMDYLQYRGEYVDVPIDEIEATFRNHYGGLKPETNPDFEGDVDRETAKVGK